MICTDIIPNGDCDYCGKGVILIKSRIMEMVQNFADGKISREAFWALAKFKRPTHQISFHTARALATLKFKEGYEVESEK